jgi:hypothetical protein
VRIGGVDHASLWSGSAASWVDLSPAGATRSHIYSTSGGQQAGLAVVGGITRASLWRGTSASWVDLHPVGAISSTAYSTSGTHQAGIATFGIPTPPFVLLSASLWRGTAASWEDLSLALSGSWGFTAAQDVWDDGITLYVVGYGFNNTTGRNEALMWSRPLDTCYADCDGNTVLDVFDFLCFQDLFATGNPEADCDGNTVLDVFDFLCFQDAFVAGCP